MATINKSPNKSRSQPRPKSAKNMVHKPSSPPSNGLPVVRVNGNTKSKMRLTSSGLSVTGSNMFTSPNSPPKNKSVEFSCTEAEYIRNLQQQIYFLELECDYLREQMQKFSVIPNSVSLETGRLSRKLETMQTELEQKEKSLLQKDNAIDVLRNENDDVNQKLESAEEIFSNEKKDLVNQIVFLKKQIERNELDEARKDVNADQMTHDYDKILCTLKDSDNKFNLLQAQFNETTDAHNQLRIMYEESRANCIKIQADFHELEERFFNSKAKSMEEIDRSLKDELKNMRYDLREKQLQADHDRALRLKIAEDCSALVKENAALSSQTIELTKHLDMERDFKHDKTERNQATIQELITLKEEKNHLTRELSRTTNLLSIEKDKYSTLLDKYSCEEENHTRARLQRSKLKAELDELEGLESVGSEENTKLRRDNLLLTDKVTKLKVMLREKKSEVEEIKNRFNDLQVLYANLEKKQRAQTHLDTIKWDEFERMADQMKQFSITMTSPTRSIPPSSSATALMNRSFEADTT